MTIELRENASGGPILATGDISDTGGSLTLAPYGTIVVSPQAQPVNCSAHDDTSTRYYNTVAWSGTLFDITYRPLAYGLTGYIFINYKYREYFSYDGDAPYYDNTTDVTKYPDAPGTNPWIAAFDETTIYPASTGAYIYGVFIGGCRATRERKTTSSTSWNVTHINADYFNYKITIPVRRAFTYLPIRNSAGTGLLRGSNGLPLVDA